MISRLLHKPYRILHQIVFPPKCLACESFFHPPECEPPVAAEQDGRRKETVPLSLPGRLDRALSNCLCQACIRQLIAVESPICNCCGLPYINQSGADHLCGDCISEPKFFRIARAPLVYETVLTGIIHRFKYKGKIQLAGPLAEILLTSFSLLWEDDSIDIILPVPLHLKKIRKRGFNQAYLLVRSWKHFAGQELFRRTDIPIERHLLIRTAATAPQSALGRAKRAMNVKNAFDLDDRDKVKDQRILLIDDVYTTGSTVNECARLLLNCGARHVDVLTLARAV